MYKCINFILLDNLMYDILSNEFLENEEINDLCSKINIKKNISTNSEVKCSKSRCKSASDKEVKECNKSSRNYNNKTTEFSNIVNLNKTYYSIVNKNYNPVFNSSKYITIEDLGGSNICKKLRENYKFELVKTENEIKRKKDEKNKSRSKSKNNSKNLN